MQCSSSKKVLGFAHWGSSWRSHLAANVLQCNSTLLMPEGQLASKILVCIHILLMSELSTISIILTVHYDSLGTHWNQLRSDEEQNRVFPAGFECWTIRTLSFVTKIAGELNHMSLRIQWYYVQYSKNSLEIPSISNFQQRMNDFNMIRGFYPRVCYIS